VALLAGRYNKREGLHWAVDLPLWWRLLVSTSSSSASQR
jgi:hypothetical protein